MTLLHQAAQKAVEALKYMLREKSDYMRRNKLGDPSKEWATKLVNEAIEALESALQHQEVPREPVATLRVTLEYDDGDGPLEIVCHGTELNMRRLDARLKFLHRLEKQSNDCAASPSTTRQQEVGSRKQLTEEQIILATEHISMERPGVFVYVARAIERAHGIGVAAAPSTPENAGGVPAVAPAQPLNGVAATVYHDEGAYAQCGACGRYTLDPMALSARPRACECGEKLGWCGSFKKPGPNAKWSNHFTPADGVQEVVSQTPPPLGTDGGTPQ